MDLRIRIETPESTATLESLSDWLRTEPELAGKVRLSGREPKPGELGAGTDALLVAAVGSGGTLSVLAASLTAWLSRPRRSDMRIRLEGQDGRVAEITADRTDGERVEALLRIVLGNAEPKD